LKAFHAPKTFHSNRVIADALHGDQMQALEGAGFKLLAMFYTVGSTSISSDEVKLAKRQRARQEE
jgi:hypothetical protein